MAEEIRGEQVNEDAQGKTLSNNEEVNEEEKR